MQKVLCFLSVFVLAAALLAAAPAEAFRFLGMGKPSARQRHKAAYMLNGRHMARPHARHKPSSAQR